MKAVILEDDPLVVRTITTILEGIGVSCKVATTASQFMPLLVQAVADSTSKPGREVPTFALLDVFVEGGGGLPIFEQIREQFPFIPVVFCSGLADVSLAVAQLKNGAMDFLQKPFRSGELIDAAQAALNQFEINYTRYLAVENACEMWDGLTVRERELIPLLLGAESTRKIAGLMNISPRTVEAHRANVMQKLGAESLIDLSSFWGLLNDSPRFSTVLNLA
ncbi:MAG: response regulator [Planctomycetaceae bacterium]